MSCQQPGVNNPGSEYMPDMAHPVGYEANLYAYYYHNRWGGEEDYYKYAQPRVPVKGTIARDSYGAGATNVYDYGNTEEERTRAMNQLIDNPYPITDKGLARGKELYDVMCGICHGDKGDGVGYLVREDGGKYPAAPVNFLLEEHVNSSNGRYYHAIMHGKNVMGGYSDKLNYEERWQVIHYIRSLQAKELKLEYNQLKNTLNTVDRPAGEIVVVEEVKTSETHNADGHGHDHGHEQSHH